jgi:hypothetical protein
MMSLENYARIMRDSDDNYRILMEAETKIPMYDKEEMKFNFISES